MNNQECVKTSELLVQHWQVKILNIGVALLLSCYNLKLCMMIKSAVELVTHEQSWVCVKTSELLVQHWRVKTLNTGVALLLPWAAMISNFARW